MKISITAFAAILLVPPPALAQAAKDGETRDNRDIIVTGTKFSGDFGAKSGIPIERVPQSVQIIGADDIIEQGARSVGDLLRGVPSANAGFSRVGSYQSFSLKVRGFLADQMRNGIRQRYYEDVDASALSNIERVEVLKGPSGVLYGQSAVGGIISIITKRPQDKGTASFAGTVGNYHQRMFTVDLTGGLAPGLSIRVTGEDERSGTFVDFQDLDRLNGALSLRYAPSGQVTANLVAEYVERKTKRYPGLPVKGTVEPNGGLPLARNLNLGEPAVDRLTADAPLIQAWVDLAISDGWSITPRVQYQEFNSGFTQIRLRAPQADLTTINRNGRTGKEDDSYTIGQLDLTGALRTGPVRHRVLLGYEYDRERSRFTQFNLTNVAAISVLAPAYAFNTVAPATNFTFDQFYNIDGSAIYLQDQIDLTERWNLIGAIRHSWIKASTRDVNGPFFDESRVESTIWQIGSSYKLSDSVSVYAGYNTGFDIESSAGARAADGKPLRPEESNQSEIGLRFKSGPLRGSVSAFEIKRVNALTTDPVNPDFSINVGAQRVRGIEVEGSWQPLDWWTLHAGYAYLASRITRSNDGDQGLRIGDVPKHSLTARTEIAIPGIGLTLRGGFNHVSNRLLVNGSSTTLPPYTLLDLGAGYRFEPFSLDVSVGNLLDERYLTASGNVFAVIPGDPRTVSVRLGVSF